MSNRKAFRLIMGFIAQSCVSTRFQDGEPCGEKYSFIRATPENPVRIGDLVIMDALKGSEWHFSWVMNTLESNDNRGTVHTLRSVETGRENDFHWVALSYLDRAAIALFPEFRWTDRQIAFGERWRDVCSQEFDPHRIEASDVDFFEDGRVVLGIRSVSRGNHFSQSITLKNWQKVTRREMRRRCGQFISPGKSATADLTSSPRRQPHHTGVTS